MSTRSWRRLIGLGMAIGLAACLVGPSAEATTSAVSAPAPAGGSVVDLSASFAVINQNRSHIACGSDAKPYTVRGELVAPRSMLTGSGPRSVALYLHNLGWSRDYWHFKAVPGYDYAAQMARLGHASLVYDLLGYGRSDKPVGTEVCYGSQADVAHQIVAALRSGHYSLGKGSGVAFKRVVLAVQSISALTAQPEATSFNDVDGLVVTSWADETPTQRLLQESGEVQSFCAQGGEPSGPGGPPGYAPVPLANTEFVASYFHNADPRVVAAATAARTRTPCGEPESAVQSIADDQVELSLLTIPVLLVYGTADALWNQPQSGRMQTLHYTSSHDVTLRFIAGSGQALALERTAPQFDGVMSSWLCNRFDRCNAG